jgi:hypothetical protein
MEKAMILSYTDSDGKMCKAKANISTDYSTYSYGQPVIVLADSGVLDPRSWVGLSCQVVKATAKERSELQEIGLL